MSVRAATAARTQESSSAARSRTCSAVSEGFVAARTRTSRDRIGGECFQSRTRAGIGCGHAPHDRGRVGRGDVEGLGADADVGSSRPRASSPFPS